MRLKLEFNGTTAEFVGMVDTLAKEENGIGLDSYDAGDAMGWVLTEAQLNFGEFSCTRGELTINAWIEYENYEWGGLTDEILIRPPLN